VSTANRVVSPGTDSRCVRTADGQLLSVPPDWILLPPGDAGLTRRVKAAGPTWAVQEKVGRRTFSRGVWAAGDVVDRIRRELDVERATPEYARKREAASRRRDNQQAEYVGTFRLAVLNEPPKLIVLLVSEIVPLLLQGPPKANVPPPVWQRRFRDAVPERLDGAAFLDRYQGTTDVVTAVDPARSYAVRAATEHPIYEHARVMRFRDILAGGAASADARAELGELMFASHASYSACGLGSDGTDRLVELARAAGPAAGIHGAKITGGGSGGTVVVLATAGRRAIIEAIADRYRAETGRQPTVFSNSSDGARAAGLARMTP